MKKQFFKSLKPNQTQLIPHVSDYQFNDRISNLTFVISFLLILINLLLVWINFAGLPPQIPLFMQRNWGTEQLADKNLLWLQGGMLVLFFLLNYAISLMALKNEPLTARILGGTVLICSLMSLISVWHVMDLVIAVRLWF